MTEYHVCHYKQLLRSGTWGSPDCDWDWEVTHETYRTLEGAQNAMKHLRACANVPIHRLYEVQTDRWGCVLEEALLDEIN